MSDLYFVYKEEVNNNGNLHSIFVFSCDCGIITHMVWCHNERKTEGQLLQC